MKVHNAALSFAPGTIHMAARLPDGAAAGASVADVEARHGKINYGGLKIGKGGEEAVAVTLDSLNLTGVSFFKLDVQGAERLALYGARETIRRSLPTVIYEVRRVHIGGKEGGGVSAAAVSLLADRACLLLPKACFLVAPSWSEPPLLRLSQANPPHPPPPPSPRNTHAPSGARRLERHAGHDRDAQHPARGRRL